MTSIYILLPRVTWRSRRYTPAHLLFARWRGWRVHPATFAPSDTLASPTISTVPHSHCPPSLLLLHYSTLQGQGQGGEAQRSQLPTVSHAAIAVSRAARANDLDLATLAATSSGLPSPPPSREKAAPDLE